MTWQPPAPKLPNSPDILPDECVECYWMKFYSTKLKHRKGTVAKVVPGSNFCQEHQPSSEAPDDEPPTTIQSIQDRYGA